MSGAKVPSKYQHPGDWQNHEHCVQVLGKHLPCLPEKGEETVKKYTCGG